MSHIYYLFHYCKVYNVQESMKMNKAAWDGKKYSMHVENKEQSNCGFAKWLTDIYMGIVVN